MSVSSQTRTRRGSGVPVRRRRFVLRKSTVRLMTMIAVVVVALAIGTWLVGKVLRPIRLVSNEQRARDRVVAEYKSLAKENDQLRRQLRDLQTLRGIEREARKHGFVMPGEITVVVPEQQTKKAGNRE